MRFIVQVTLPVEPFNTAVRDGSAGRRLGQILEDTRPEAVYFTSLGGQRAVIMVVEMTDASDMPRIGEPWFLSFNARLEIFPTMSPEDLQKSGLDEIAAKYK